MTSDGPSCALGPEEGAERLARWRRLSRQHGDGGRRETGYAVLRFRHTPGVAQELRELVELERACCPFLGWDITPAGNVLVLRITGEDDVLASLPLLD